MNGRTKCVELTWNRLAPGAGLVGKTIARVLRELNVLTQLALPQSAMPTTAEGPS